ncbi:O-antigen ligase family protein [Rhodopirellula sp. MGV]|uniref:O-antigen ligase family protein n=1 Tax=Rhodopirellula sp. MGV TaxID=2023130 RepID=UPI0013047B0D|nr:O-antigen ligase family protein [Rhodopirellula sp. MGV]
MAKGKQRLNKPPAETSVASSPFRAGGDAADVPAWSRWCRLLAAAALAGVMVYVAFHPSDSVELEHGGGVWFCAFGLVTWALTMISEPWVASGEKAAATSTVGRCFGGVSVDAAAWLLAIWMMVSALVMCPPGNLRSSTNEAWFWIAAAALLTSARRLLTDKSCRVMAVSILVAITFAMSVDACYQFLVTIPQMQADYLADPDKMIQEAGIDAPRQSAARMVFANRLLDGGPTSTFLLANSLAALLSVPVIAGATAIMGWRQKRFPGWAAGLGLLAMTVGGVALAGTQSRSGLLSCLIATVFLLGGVFNDQSSDSDSPLKRKRLALPITVGAIAVALVFALVGLLSDAEWIDAAPASLLFRLQYWKSTVAMLMDYPWFGVGPGSFQSLYLRYRVPEANETIADPHNFFFETLAAGGFIAGALLLALAFTLYHSKRSGRGDESPNNKHSGRGDESRSNKPNLHLAHAMLIGAIASTLVVKLLGVISGEDIDLLRWALAIPAATISGGIVWWLCGQPSSVEPAKRGIHLRSSASAALLAMMIHLCVSGGWTVPGVAMVIWIVAAIATRSPQTDATAGSQFLPSPLAAKASLAVLFVAAMLLLAFRSTSLLPVTEAKVAMAQAEYAAIQGMSQRAVNDIQSAVQADPWDTLPAVWMSDMMKRRLVSGSAGSSGSGSARDRQNWVEATEEALRRCGVDPLARRTIAEQYLHVYQRFGQQQDLERADQILQAVVPNNPTDVSLLAQAALVARALGRDDQAAELAHQAGGLSKLGGNVVRLLGLQFVYVVRPIGVAASDRPQQERIKVLFNRIPGWPTEP